MVRNVFLWTSVFLLFSAATLVYQPLKAQGNLFFNGTRQKEIIPFIYHRNLIIIPVSINGHGPYNFILDTGVNFLILTNPNLKKEIGIKVGKVINIRGLGEGNDIQAGIVNDLSLSIGHIHGNFFSAAIFPEDLLPFSSYVGIQVDGIIGNDLFRQFIVEINYQKQQMTIRMPGTWKPGRRFAEQELLIENQRPYLKVNTHLSSGQSIQLNLIIDTGAGHPISLEAGSLPVLKLPIGSLSARIGMGLNGPINGLLGRLPTLTLGNYMLKNVICSYPLYTQASLNLPTDGRNGNIGNGVLDHFCIVMDYPGKRMYFRKSNRLNKPFEYDMSGLDLITGGADFNNFIVSGVDPGSPAEIAGLKEQDIILLIDLVPANNMNISEIDNLLRSGNGKKIQVVYQRNGKIGLATLVLHRRV